MFTEERAHWLYRHYLWLEQHLPPHIDGSTSQLILPNAQFYPHRNTLDHAYAEKVFASTRHFMGLDEWPCRLEPQSDEAHERHADFAKSANLFLETKTASAAGTFSAAEEVVITYAPRLLKDPSNLVATLAHELCHYLLANVAAEPPCGWAEHEPLTDLAAVHEGFGVFLCNSAFTFDQWSDSQMSGWSFQKLGYLNDSELAFALGVFCTRRKADADAIMRHLKPNPAEVFWDSLVYIEDLERQNPSR
jgi:hypothetical protein